MRLWLWFVRFIGTLLRPRVLTALMAVALITGGALIIATADAPQIQVALLTSWWRSWWGRPLPAVQQRRTLDQIIAAQSDDSVAFPLIMKKQVWAEGYSPLIRVEPFEGKPPDYWAIFRGTTETGSHVDGDGRPVSRLCLHLYAEKVRRDDDGIIAPHPYFLGFMAWPEALVKCIEDQRQYKYQIFFFELPFKHPPSAGQMMRGDK